MDLATMPLYVRAGSVLPLGPVRQYADEPSDEAVTLVVYPGADGTSVLYDDDGSSFAYTKGEWMRIELTWRDRPRRLGLRLSPGSRMVSPTPRHFNVRPAGSNAAIAVEFAGRPLEVRLP